jgi:hypothetical protein
VARPQRRRRVLVVMVKKLRCWLGWHRWERHVNDEGQAYWLCADCDKFKDIRGNLDAPPPPGVSV